MKNYGWYSIILLAFIDQTRGRLAQLPYTCLRMFRVRYFGTFSRLRLSTYEPYKIYILRVDQFVQIIRKQLAEKGRHGRWQTRRDTLNGQQRVTSTFKRADQLTLHVRKATRVEPEQLIIYQALDLNPAPGGVKKMVV